MRCPHLLENNLCSVYERRPQICRDYQADALCEQIAAPTLDERVAKYLALFELSEEAQAVKQSGCSSLRAFRQAPN
jgi:uncharacterized protein